MTTHELTPGPSAKVQDDNVTTLRIRPTVLEPVPAPKPGLVEVLKDRAPAIWTEQLPSLSDVVKYGRNAKYTGPRGALRRLGQAYSWFVVGVTGVVYGFLWAIKVPSRAFITAVIITLFYFTVRAF